jgi:hypothetical protein
MGDERGPSAALVAGGVAVVLVLGGGAWYFLSNRGSTEIDSGGFDLGAAPKTVHPFGVAAPADAPAPRSGLEMLSVDAKTKAELTGTAPAAKPETPATRAAGAPTLSHDPAQARADFVAQARKHEASVRDFAVRMTAKSPVVAQYGRDWMSHDDLKKLNDDYMRTHDPVAFMAGLSKAPSFPGLLKKYAGSPQLTAAVVLGVTQEAPGELVDAGLNWVHTDPSIKNTISSIATALGLPPEMIKKLTAAEAATAKAPAK